MAKTTKAYVRLVKHFPAPEHRRAGVTLAPSPEYVEAEVTADQLKALKDDPSVEVAKDKKAAEKNNSKFKLSGEQTGESIQDPTLTGEQPSANAPLSVNGGNPDPTRVDSPETGDFRVHVPRGGEDEGDLMDLTRLELEGIASTEGVEGADQMRNKGAIAEAILDVRGEAPEAMAAETETPQSATETGVEPGQDEANPNVEPEETPVAIRKE